MNRDLSSMPITELKGVGDYVANCFAKLGIYSIFDLLLHFPIRYQNRSSVTPICNLVANATACVEGIIQHTEIQAKRRRMLVSIIDDGTATLTIRFFNFNQLMLKNLAVGKKVSLFGDVKGSAFNLEMLHPEFKILSSTATTIKPTNQLTAIYPSTANLKQSTIRNIITNALLFLNKSNLVELLPANLNPYKLSVVEAIKILHSPPIDIDLTLLANFQHPAQQRIIYEELLSYILALSINKHERQRQQACLIQPANEALAQFSQALPFQLTKAQRKVMQEIATDISQAQPMLRLIQGDVGSGKTVVAAFATYLAINNGYQVAIMAPTEILAEQHLVNFSNLLADYQQKIILLTGKSKGKKREQIYTDIANGSYQIIIGTHTLFQTNLNFHNLALIIIDEQHRFGVEQRFRLLEKGYNGKYIPHQLIMTATPIPRTLTMSVYAELDISIIDELPPGRTPITTVIMPEAKREQIIERVAHTCQTENRQVYWVCPLIAESETLTAQAAEQIYTLLQSKLNKIKIGLIHGKMKAEEKKTIMSEFKAGNIQLLVATTVIEVGVDVANASLMIIENAERLGLSQLHQLRGRVGRGNINSYCILIYQANISMIAKKRLQIIRASTDGFYIAEQDLHIRGSGEILGTKQTGIAAFRIADLVRDHAIISLAKHYVTDLCITNNTITEPLIQRWLKNKVLYHKV